MYSSVFIWGEKWPMYYFKTSTKIDSLWNDDRICVVISNEPMLLIIFHGRFYCKTLQIYCIFFLLSTNQFLWKICYWLIISVFNRLFQNSSYPFNTRICLYFNRQVWFGNFQNWLWIKQLIYFFVLFLTYSDQMNFILFAISCEVDLK